MEGKKLYEMYVRAAINSGARSTGYSTFDELNPDIQTAWNTLAEDIKDFFKMGEGSD